MGKNLAIIEQRPHPPFWAGYFLLTFYLNAWALGGIGLTLYHLSSDKGADGPYNFAHIMPIIWIVFFLTGLINGWVTKSLLAWRVTGRKVALLRINALCLGAISLPVSLYAFAEHKIGLLLRHSSPSDFFLYTLLGSLVASLSAQLIFFMLQKIMVNRRVLGSASTRSDSSLAKNLELGVNPPVSNESIRRLED